MWYDALERKELERIHAGLGRQVGKLCDLLREESLELPSWATDVAADLQAINRRLWEYRLASSEHANTPDSTADNSPENSTPFLDHR